jgi:multiple sugar transport system permease protein
VAKHKSLRLSGLFKAFAMLVVCFWSGLPIALIFLSSLKLPRDIFASPPSLFFTPTLNNYARLWAEAGNIFSGMLNSLIVTVGTTSLAVLVSLLAAYAYSRYRSRLLSVSAFFLIAIRLIPPIVITIPLFPAVNALSLNDTHFILIILYTAFFVSLGTFVMRTFIDQIPRELDEAAIIDGASRLQVISKVILPLSAQGIVAVAVFIIVFAWNEFLFAFIFTSSFAKTAPLALAELNDSFDGVQWGVVFAAASVQLVPILIFIIITQKYLVAGLTAGATKG